MSISLLAVLAQLKMAPASTDHLKHFQVHENHEEIAAHTKIHQRTFERILAHNGFAIYQTIMSSEIKTYKSGKVVTKTKQERILGSDISGRWNEFVRQTEGAAELMDL